MAKKFKYEQNAGRVDAQREHESRARRKAIEASPDLKKLKSVRVDHKTMIFINPQRDAAQAVQNFKERHNEFVKQNYPVDL